MNPKLLLLLGPTGVGKNTVMKCLFSIDHRFITLPTYTTRPRKNVEDKVPISDAAMDSMLNSRQLLSPMNIYGYRYATPTDDTMNALMDEQFPMTDWNVEESRIKLMRDFLPGRLYIVYLIPPNLDSLRTRLGVSWIGQENQRFTQASSELEKFYNGDFDGLYDIHVVNEDNREYETAKVIYQHYLNAVNN